MKTIFGLIGLSLMGVSLVEAQTGEPIRDNRKLVAPKTSIPAKLSLKQSVAASRTPDEKPAASCRAAQGAQPQDDCTTPSCRGHYIGYVHTRACYQDNCPDIVDFYAFKVDAAYEDGYNAETACFGCGGLTCSDYACP